MKGGPHAILARKALGRAVVVGARLCLCQTLPNGHGTQHGDANKENAPKEQPPSSAVAKTLQHKLHLILICTGRHRGSNLLASLLAAPAPATPAKIAVGRNVDVHAHCWRVVAHGLGALAASPPLFHHHHRPPSPQPVCPSPVLLPSPPPPTVATSLSLSLSFPPPPSALFHSRCPPPRCGAVPVASVVFNTEFSPADNLAPQDLSRVRRPFFLEPAALQSHAVRFDTRSFPCRAMSP